MHWKLLACCLAILLLTPISSHAVVIWDEAGDGDLGAGLPGTDVGLLGGGAFDILGDLDGGTGTGPVPDEGDIIKFTTSGSWTLDAVSLTLGSATGLFFFLFDGANSIITGAVVGSPTTDVLGTFAAGTYNLSFFPQFNTGTLSYTARINVASVPEPGTLSLLGIGLLALGLTRRRRAK